MLQKSSGMRRKGSGSELEERCGTKQVLGRCHTKMKNCLPAMLNTDFLMALTMSDRNFKQFEKVPAQQILVTRYMSVV